MANSITQKPAEPNAKGAEIVVQKAPEPEPLTSTELSHEEQVKIAESVERFVGSFKTSDAQNLAVTRFTMPLSQIIKNPAQEKWRTILFTNALLKPVVASN